MLMIRNETELTGIADDINDLFTELTTKYNTSNTENLAYETLLDHIKDDAQAILTNNTNTVNQTNGTGIGNTIQGILYNLDVKLDEEVLKKVKSLESKQTDKSIENRIKLGKDRLREKVLGSKSQILGQ